MVRTVKGYRIIDIPLLNGSLHSLFIKAHTDKNDDGDSNGKVAFIGNVDYGLRMTYEEIDGYLRDLFQGFGDIESVSVSKFKGERRNDSNNDEDIQDEDDWYQLKKRERENNTMSRFAHVAFAKKGALKAALTASDATYYQLGESIVKKWGLDQRFRLKRKRSPEEIASMFPYIQEKPEDLEEEVNSFMMEYEEKEEMDKKEREMKSRMADEDGFMPVQHRKKKKRVQEKRGSGNARARAPKKVTELKNFYRFQMREERRGKLDELRKKFEEDKEKVAAMKAQRKFKPF